MKVGSRQARDYTGDMLHRVARLGLLVMAALAIILVGCQGRPSSDPTIARVTIAAASTQAAIDAAALAGSLTETPVSAFLTNAAPTLAMAGLQELPQFAITASADTERGSPDRSALQTIGLPNTPVCEDAETAWSSEAPNSEAALTVAFAQPVIPTQVNIYESLYPGFVTAVEVVDLYGESHVVYQVEPRLAEECPRVLSIPVEEADYRANVVIIHLDQRPNPGGWSAIDAVELQGIR